MTNHVNKGKQKSSVGQYGNPVHSAAAKSAKMEAHHEKNEKKRD